MRVYWCFPAVLKPATVSGQIGRSSLSFMTGTVTRVYDSSGPGHEFLYSGASPWPVITAGLWSSRENYILAII